MTKTDAHNAETNVRLYTVLKTLSKRPYLPLIAIYFVQVVGLSVAQIGILAAITAIARMAAEIPSGYMSDRWSRKYTIVLAGLFGIVSMLIRVTVLDLSGAIISVILESIAYAFLSGTGQAMLHDSLDVLKKTDDYTRLSSRAQSISLAANVVVIAIVPLTYAVDTRLPFVIGAVQFLAMMVLGLKLADLQATKPAESTDIPSAKGIAYLRKHRSFIIFAAVAGFFGATMLSPVDFQSLALLAGGLPPEKMGLLFAAASLVAVIIGRYITKLKSLPIRTYAAIDVSVATTALLLLSSSELWMLCASFIIGMSFWRFRGIIYEESILRVYKTKHKATLLSVIQNVEQLSTAIQAVALGMVVGVVGLSNSFIVAAIFTALVGIVFVAAVSRFLADSNQ